MNLHDTRENAGYTNNTFYKIHFNKYQHLKNYYGTAENIIFHSFPFDDYKKDVQYNENGVNISNSIAIKFDKKNLSNPEIFKNETDSNIFFNAKHDSEIFFLKNDDESKLLSTFNNFIENSGVIPDSLKVVYYEKGNKSYIIVFLDESFITNGAFVQVAYRRGGNSGGVKIPNE